jgi:hypothetical protein
VQFDERRTYVVSTRYEGWIEKLLVNTTGEKVRRGPPLMQVYSPDLVLAQQEYALLRQSLQEVDPTAGESASASRQLMEGAERRIGRYVVEDELGRGMMGVVFRARDPELGRTVALKTVQVAFAATPEEQESFERRFLAEARAAARLSHEHRGGPRRGPRPGGARSSSPSSTCAGGRSPRSPGTPEWREAVRSRPGGAPLHATAGHRAPT